MLIMGFVFNLILDLKKRIREFNCKWFLVNKRLSKMQGGNSPLLSVNKGSYDQELSPRLNKASS